MKLKPLHLACKIDDQSPNMRLIEIKNGIAQASNGKVLVKIELINNSELSEDDINFLNGKYIDMEVWKEAHKCDNLSFEEDAIIVHKNGIKKSFEYSIPSGTFYNFDDLVITIKNAEAEPKLGVSMKSDAIEILSKIFESNVLQFAFSTGFSGILVTNHEGSGMFGIIPLASTDVINRYFYLT